MNWLSCGLIFNSALQEGNCASLMNCFQLHRQKKIVNAIWSLKELLSPFRSHRRLTREFRSRDYEPPSVLLAVKSDCFVQSEYETEKRAHEESIQVVCALQIDSLLLIVSVEGAPRVCKKHHVSV
eukprot:c21011_g2_i1 orf=266-640(+)